MARVTATSPHVDQPFGWRVAEVLLDLTTDGDTGTIDIPVFDLPGGSIILNASVVCTVAEAGATSSAVDIELGAGSGVNIIAAADLGTLGTTENTITEATLGTLNGILLATASTSSVTVNAEVTITGTATTAPAFAVAILAGRTQY